MKICLSIAIALLVSSCVSKPLKLHSYKAVKMGVDFRIDLYAESEEMAEQAASKAFDRIEQINSVMSDYIVDSELWKLSDSSGSNSAFRVSNDMWQILNFSKRINQLSEGAFDITAGPYILLWRKARVIKRLPDERSMKRAANRVGMDKIMFNDVDKSVKLAVPKMRLDLGGVAKGYAADEALKVLKAEGIEYAMVDGSGDISMTAHPEGDWRIFISDSQESSGFFVELSSCSIATSGDTFQNVEIGGKRFSHIVDPKTGIGVTDSFRVTVIARDGKTADALASSLTVMGPEKGISLVEKMNGVEALVSKMEDGKRISYKSSGFPKMNFKNHMEKK